jgi:hypothetical protein
MGDTPGLAEPPSLSARPVVVSEERGRAVEQGNDVGERSLDIVVPREQVRRPCEGSEISTAARHASERLALLGTTERDLDCARE